MERFGIAFSEGEEKEKCFEEAINDLENQVGKDEPKLVVYYSDVENFVFYTEKLHEKYPNTQIIGSTTYMSLSSKGRGDLGFSVMAVMYGIEVSTGEILEISKCPIKYYNRISDAIANIHDYKNTVCFEFTTAFCNTEELVLDTLKRQLSPLGIPVIGSSAGAETGANINFVSLNGKIYYEGCVFALIHNENGRIGIFDENFYKTTIHRFMITDADSDEKRIYELNDDKILNVLSTSLNLPQEYLKEHINDYPLGRIYGHNIYITEPHEILEDGSITFHARIYNYTDVVLLERESTDNTRKCMIEEIQKSGIKPSFSLIVNGFDRVRMLKKENILDKIEKEIKEMLGEYIGICGYGEQLDFEQVNETMIICIFE